MSQSSGFAQNTHFIGLVRDLTYKGAGVVDHPDGRVYFVEGAWPGDEAEFEITKTDKRFGHAKVVKLIKPSSDRVSAACPHHGFKDADCGGCPWMMVNYEAQISAKIKILINQLARAKVLFEESTLKPIFTSKQFGYRNRAQLKTNGEVIGFVSRGSKSIAPINDCVVLTDNCREKLKALKSALPNKYWLPDTKYLWNFIEVSDLSPIEDSKLNHRLPFMQGNSSANAQMQDWVAKKTVALNFEDTGDISCLELFAGSGNFTSVLSQHLPARCRITATEIDQRAIDSLNGLNLKNVTGVALDIYSSDSLRQLKSRASAPQLLFLDPPREGFELIAPFLKEFPTLRHILYVSCDPSSLARDLKAVQISGFEVKEIQPVDQFPNTSHLETLCLLSKP